MPSPDKFNSDLELGQTIRGFVAGQKLFGRYLMVQILGRGGMGVVWLARDEKLNRDVALKFLPELVMHDAATLDGLKRETNRCLDLTHHNIVRIYDFAQDAQSACISMEYVDGPTLSALRVERESKVFEVSELAPWVVQACEALVYAHETAKIVHRDLKPANLMLNSKGEIKVADFGIARSLTDSVSILTMAHGSSGTLVYMSPQQLAGAKASRPDDIYSLGATIYELLTSKPPFYSGNIDAQIRERTPMSMAERRAELELATTTPIPAVWEETVAACLAKDPAQRPQSAGEVAHRLELSEHFPPSRTQKDPVQPEIVREPLNALVGKSKKSVLTAALLTLLATGVVGGWWFGLERPRRKAERQRQLTEQKTKDERDSFATRQREMSEEEHLTSERKVTADAEAEKNQLAATQRAKEEAAKKKEDSLNAAAEASKEQPYENSIGMKFVPVPGINVLFSVWETRIKDFQAFVEATKYDATGGMYSLEEKKGWAQVRRTWKDPGFAQTGEHAVCGVSWQDATAFCEWLTERERKAERINSKQRYRLPTDEEWSVAVGLEKETGSTPKERSGKLEGVYPWGATFPPPDDRAGNYAGSEVRTGGWKSDWKTIKGCRDQYPRTSPVGSFEANRNGIYDLGGNVWEWCQDWYDSQQKSRVLRGASWSNSAPGYLLSSYRDFFAPDRRDDGNGFRCVLAVDSSR